MIDFSRIEKYRENNRIEAKRASGGFPGSVWETYSAFANSDGGVILLGVAESKKDKTLYPVELPDPWRLVAQFWEALPRAVNKNILKKTDVTVEEVDGKEIVVIRIPKAKKKDKPIYIGGNPLMGSDYRRDEGDIRIPEARVKQMIEENKA